MSDIARAMRERDQAFEAQYKLDEEQGFKLRARRDRFFGEWVAKKLGKRAHKIELYAVELAKINLEKAGDDNMIEKVIYDLKLARKPINNDELLDALAAAQARAIDSIKDDHPNALGTDHGF